MTFTGWSAAEEEKLGDALASVADIVQSSRFTEAVASRSDINETPQGPSLAGADVLASLAARVPVELVKASSSSHETADTCIRNGIAKTNLGSENLDRWPAGTSTPELVRRACLVNTLLHESMHAIPGERTCGERFIDRGHQHSKVKLVPYTVGSIAECAYLEKFGVIQRSRFWSCVDATGTSNFYGKSVCEKVEWLARLRAVAESDAGPRQ